MHIKDKKQNRASRELATERWLQILNYEREKDLKPHEKQRARDKFFFSLNSGQ